ncbi:hypothetical protein BGY98DRAFT_319016 [Russula aff. rugulosa BPL654]|nr:hypothetical protein BGY98DRAFT_319016 [Russula aff. rugulosa BPL654]
MLTPTRCLSKLIYRHAGCINPFSPPPVPRPSEQPIACLDSRPPPVPQLTLADFKLVVIVDDSDSMDGKLWIEARDALAGVAELTRLKGGEGLDIYCLNSPASRLDLRNEVEIINFFNDIVQKVKHPLATN